MGVHRRHRRIAESLTMDDITSPLETADRSSGDVLVLHRPETDAERIVREARLVIAEDVAWELIGGCISMAIVAGRRDIELDQDLEESILARAFQCDRCGWWHSVEELNNLTHRELCDSCDAEENPVNEDDAPVSNVPAPTSGGGTDMGAILKDLWPTRSPSVLLVMTDGEPDVMANLRIAANANAENPSLEVLFLHD